MKRARNLVLILFFLGLAALEIAHGLFRMRSIREGERQTLFERVERSHRELATELSLTLAEKSEHAAYLAGTPAVRTLLDAPGEPSARAALASILLPYLLAFGGIDRVRVLDRRGHEVFRCERIGGAAGVLPEPLLAREPDEEVLSVAGSAAPGKVGISELLVDRDRVEVPESDRQVLHYASRVLDGGDPRGIVDLTVYARPLLKAVGDFAPVAGVSADLIERSGRIVGAASGAAGGTPAAAPNLYRENAPAASRILSGDRRVELDAHTYLSLPVDGTPSWSLVARVPEAALESASSHLRGEYAWIIGSTVALTAFLAIAAAFVVRMSMREFRLRERGRFLERIEEESARYRALMEGAADMILIVDPTTGEIREVNAAAREQFRLAAQLAPGREADPGRPAPTLGSVLASAEPARLDAGLRAALAGERVALTDVRVTTPVGMELEVDVRMAAIALEDTRVVEVSLRDLTLQKELERRLRISERLGSLGLLTAGVAHEINNPLEGIGNYLALLEREPVDPEKRARYVSLVRHGFDRIRDIVRDLASFSSSRDQSGTADLAQVIPQALSMVRYSKKLDEARVEIRGIEAAVRVAGDPGRLEQVFINLLLNAGRATEGRGTIEVSVRRRLDGAPDDSTATARGEVEVLVEDDGPGIPEENLARLFDPFFTRAGSDDSAGLGLGLFISYGIIDAHGGTLHAENRAEGGARFVVRLPADEDAGAHEAAGGAETPQAASRDTVNEPQAHDSRR